MPNNKSTPSEPEWLKQLRKLSRQLGKHGLYCENAEAHHLTLPELGALVVIVGRDAGFTVKTEVACGPKMRHRIDCVWYTRRPDRAAVAWEFDARDVGINHLNGTFQKLEAFPGAIKVQALYTIRGEVKKESAYMIRPVFTRDITIRGIRLHTDEDLMTGDLERIVRDALA